MAGGAKPGVRVWAALSEDGKTLEIDVLNDNDVETSVPLAPTASFADARKLRVRTLAASSAAARNTLANPQTIVRTESDEELVRSPFGFDAPAHSFSSLLLTQ